MEVAVVSALVIALAAGTANGAAWSYKGKLGVDNWAELFPNACSGDSQSPINVITQETMHNPDLKDFAMWYDPPRPGSTMTLLNNGHAVQVSVSGEFYVTNGGLPYTYKTAQFHFHWGSAKHIGSEHLIDGEAYPLELHIVNWNKDMYENIGQAVTEPQGLAVLGVMFQVGHEENMAIEPIIEAMHKVADPDQGMNVPLEPMSLRNLLPPDMTRYFRYNGSLTTPGCFESVVWTVFADPVHISYRQMAKFRTMLQNAPKRHHKRSAHSRREQRALAVLEELGLSAYEQARFRRDLEAKKHKAEQVVAMVEEKGQHKGDGHTVGDIQTKVQTQEAVKSADHVSQYGLEIIQDRLVDNFRPPQPLNGRTVYRSFKLGEHRSRHRHGHHQGYRVGQSDTAETLRELKGVMIAYQAKGAGPRLAASSLVLAIAALVAKLL